MIIADINHEEFVLETLKDAETLLDILARAKPIAHDYSGNNMYYYPNVRSTIGITIKQAAIVDMEEHERIQADRRAKWAEESAAKEEDRAAA